MAALPSGSDPAFFDLGAFGIVGTGLGALLGRSQDSVADFYKGQVQGSGGWTSASSDMFAGLFPDGNTPFPILFLEAIMEQLLGYVPGGTIVIELLTELGGFFTGKWGDLSDLFASVDDLIQNIVNAFNKLDPTGATSVFGDAILMIWNIFTGIVTQSNTLASGMAALEQTVYGEAGTGIVENFNGPDETPITGWTHLKFGLDVYGQMSRKANGLVWAPAFSSNSQTDIIIRDTDRLGSPVQKTTHWLRKRVDAQGLATYWIFLRSNHTTSTGAFDGQYIKITAGTAARFGYMLGGVEHTLDGSTDPVFTPIPFTTTESDRWDFQVGEPGLGGDPWLWRVWLNNVELTPAGGFSYDLTSLNAGASVLLDTDHDYPAIGMTSYGVFIFFPQQIPPTEVEIASWQVPLV